MPEHRVVRVIPESSAESKPMHPEDYAALLAWVRAKEGEGNPRVFLD